MAVFFCGDPHFGPGEFANYIGRPFADKRDHDETIIKNWNSVVHPKDYTILMGDVGYGNAEYLYRVLQRLHGKIGLIIGNHDGPGKSLKCLPRYKFVKDVHMMSVNVDGHSQRIWLSHYSHRSWPFSNHGSWHLFGHSHGNLEPYGLSFDVGVDCWNFTPVSLDQVTDKMKTLQMKIDHDKEGKIDLLKIAGESLAKEEKQRMKDFCEAEEFRRKLRL